MSPGILSAAGGDGTDARGRAWTLSNQASIIPDLNLSQVHNLTVQSAAHGHTADNVILVVPAIVLVVQVARHVIFSGIELPPIY